MLTNVNHSTAILGKFTKIQQIFQHFIKNNICDNKEFHCRTKGLTLCFINEDIFGYRQYKPVDFLDQAH